MTWWPSGTDIYNIEGAVKRITVNAYERGAKARLRCLQLKGYSCLVCGFNFQLKYGKLGQEYIHVHHKVQLAKIKRGYTVDPEEDLIPICPNCHAMIHIRKEQPLSVEELKGVLRSNGSK